MTAKTARPTLPISGLRPAAMQKKALPLARMNLEIRKTPRACSPLSRAIAADEAAGAWCVSHPQTSHSATSAANERSLQ